jgi:hypothetical protein
VNRGAVFGGLGGRWVVPAEAKQAQRFLAKLLQYRMPPCMRMLPLPSRRDRGFQSGAVGVRPAIAPAPDPPPPSKSLLGVRRAQSIRTASKSVS